MDWIEPGLALALGAGALAGVTVLGLGLGGARLLQGLRSAAEENRALGRRLREELAEAARQRGGEVRVAVRQPDPEQMEPGTEALDVVDGRVVAMLGSVEDEPVTQIYVRGEQGSVSPGAEGVPDRADEPQTGFIDLSQLAIAGQEIEAGSAEPPTGRRRLTWARLPASGLEASGPADHELVTTHVDLQALAKARVGT